MGSEKIDSAVYAITHLGAKSSDRQALAITQELLVKPSGTDGAHLLIDGKRAVIPS